MSYTQASESPKQDAVSSKASDPSCLMPANKTRGPVLISEINNFIFKWQSRPLPHWIRPLASLGTWTARTVSHTWTSQQQPRQQQQLQTDVSPKVIPSSTKGTIQERISTLVVDKYLDAYKGLKFFHDPRMSLRSSIVCRDVCSVMCWHRVALLPCLYLSKRIIWSIKLRISCGDTFMLLNATDLAQSDVNRSF